MIFVRINSREVMKKPLKKQTKAPAKAAKTATKKAIVKVTVKPAQAKKASPPQKVKPKVVIKSGKTSEKPTSPKKSATKVVVSKNSAKAKSAVTSKSAQASAKKTAPKAKQASPKKAVSSKSKVTVLKSGKPSTVQKQSNKVSAKKTQKSAPISKASAKNTPSKPVKKVTVAKAPKSSPIPKSQPAKSSPSKKETAASVKKNIVQKKASPAKKEAPAKTTSEPVIKKAGENQKVLKKVAPKPAAAPKASDKASSEKTALTKAQEKQSAPLFEKRKPEKSSAKKDSKEKNTKPAKPVGEGNGLDPDIDVSGVDPILGGDEVDDSEELALMTPEQKKQRKIEKDRQKKLELKLKKNERNFIKPELDPSILSANAVRKEFLELKYSFDCEPRDLFMALTKPEYMRNWLAERVEQDDKTHVYFFHWRNYTESARIIEKVQDRYLKWQWVGGERPSNEFLIFSIDMIPGDVYVDLYILDICEPNEREIMTKGWDKLMDRLRVIVS
jgi:hypothetical protein